MSCKDTAMGSGGGGGGDGWRGGGMVGGGGVRGGGVDMYNINVISGLCILY